MNFHDINRTIFNENTTPNDVKKYLGYPYKQTNHLIEMLEKSNKYYADYVVELVKDRLFDEKNKPRCEFFVILIQKITWLDSESFTTLMTIVTKVLKRTKLYNPPYDIVNLIERLIEKKLTFSPEYIKLANSYAKSLDLDLGPREELSACGKYIHTYFTTRDLDGKVVSSYYMSNQGRKGGLSDQYKIHKLKEIIEKYKPEYDDWLPIVEAWVSLWNTTASKPTLKTNDEIWKQIQKDLEWEWD
jgi:hypothetical protein